MPRATTTPARAVPRRPAATSDRPYWSAMLRALREARGVTQEGWAAQLGIARSTLVRWERGEVAPDARAEEALLVLCEAKGLWRTYDRGPLAGVTVTPGWLADLLAAARLGSSSEAEISDIVGVAPTRPDLPAGTVTLLFTDIEGSTCLLQALGDRYPAVLAQHRTLLRTAFRAHGGSEVDSQGDALFYAFARADQAVAAAVEGQRALASHPWPDGATVQVRMGLHTGAPTRTTEGYAGLDVHRAARIAAAGHGGQVLLSEATAAQVRQALPAGVQLRDLGPHHLKDLPQPERLSQLDITGLPTGFPPLRALAPQPRATTLPVPLTPLIGRDTEIRAVAGLLRRDEVRLVTLTGAGGTGKTRLALAVLTEVLPDFPGGAWFVALAPLRDAALLLAAIAHALGVRETEGRSLAASVVDVLRDQRALLLLDNVEQLLPAAAPVVAELLGACPRLTMLTTSRAPLRVSGEREVPVAPLAVPDLRALPPTAELAHTPAVALFVERATAVKPDFGLTDDRARTVAAICVRVDGLPLAIELAAARIKLLPPPALLERLERRLVLLTGGARDLPARQQTLRDTIAWSYDLLGPADQRLFRRLAVFAGGCTLAAAEAVCGESSDLGPGVLDGLASLVDQSLLRQEAGADGVPRVVMLETVREYASEQLEASGEAPAIHQRWAAFFVLLAEQAEAEYDGPAQATWHRRLEQEDANFRAVLGWAVATGETETGLRLASALWRVWAAALRYSEGQQWLEDLLAVGGAVPARVHAKALRALGQLVEGRGDRHRALTAYEESLQRYRALGDPRGIAEALADLGGVLADLGDLARAAALLEESLTRFRQLDAQVDVAWVLLQLGVVVRLRGDLESAQALLEESLTLHRAGGNREGIAGSLESLGILARLRRDFGRAAVLFEEALAVVRELGLHSRQIALLQHLAVLRIEAGDYYRALALLKESLGLCRPVDFPFATATALLTLGSILAGMSRPEQAARLFGAGERLLEVLGRSLPSGYADSYARTVAQVRATVGEERFAAAFVTGRALSLEAAIAEALAVAAAIPAEVATAGGARIN